MSAMDVRTGGDTGGSGRIVLIFGGRFPGEKAASIFALEEARAFAAGGSDVVVLVPRRSGRERLGHEPFRTVYLPTIDLLGFPLLARFAGYVNTLTLAASAALWCLLFGKKGDCVISNEALPLLAATHVAGRTLYEMHDFPESALWIYRRLFARVSVILVTNEWKRGELARCFGVSDEKVLLERNAVDTNAFGSFEREDARERLGLPKDARIVLYTGQLFPWKGADTLAEAAALLPKDVLVVFVGGVGEDLAQFRSRWGASGCIRILGQVLHDEVPVWQAAADILVLPNSAKQPLSDRYTSPMKLFEYMASGNPIVTSDIPAVREVVSQMHVFFASPDDTKSFAMAIAAALDHPSEAAARAARARVLVLGHTWSARADRMLSRLAAAGDRNPGKVPRFIVAGATAAVINLIVLVVATELLGLWYLASSAAAFVAGFWSSFVLQKFWTFQDRERAAMGRQAAVYLGVSVANLVANLPLMYVFVDLAGLWYVLAQALAIALIALENYFILHRIFR